MGLLDSVIGALANGGGAQPQQQPGGISPALITAILGMLAGGGSQAGNSGAGGLGGVGGLGGLGDLVSKFQQNGMGDVIGSWIGTGANQPVDQAQLGGVLGHDTIGGLASSLGMSHGDVLGQLAQVLPGLVDHLTPQGQLPQAGEVPQGGLDGSMADILAQFSKR